MSWRSPKNGELECRPITIMSLWESVSYEDAFEFAETRVKGGRSRGIEENESDG